MHWVSVPFSLLSHTPQICTLIFMDTFNPFGPRMSRSQYKLIVGFVGNLVISICRCSLSVSLENFYSGSWFSWHLMFLSMNYRGTWQIIFSPFAFVAREPRANEASYSHCVGPFNKNFWKLIFYFVLILPGQSIILLYFSSPCPWFLSCFENNLFVGAFRQFSCSERDS